MAVLYVLDRYNAAEWADMMRVAAPDFDVRLWPNETGDVGEIAYAVAWKTPHGVLAQFPELRVIFSLGAGVDHIMSDPDLPDVPIVRVVDPDLTRRMSEYVVLHVLLHHRQHALYASQQLERKWIEHSQPAAKDVRVGIMGLGVLGQDAALRVRDLGFQVAGWSNSRKSVEGVESFAGAGELDAFLSHTDILACLLPHTPETDGMLNISLIERLAQDGAFGGPFLINAGRGGVQNSDDIQKALEQGLLKGASLDVFETEPWPEEHPLWAQPNVYLTPHVAAESSPSAINAYILQQIRTHEAGGELENVIDVNLGY